MRNQSYLDPRSLVSCAVGTLLVVLTVGCTKQATPPAPPPPEVVVATPEVRDIIDYRDFPGSTRAKDEVDVRARVQGVLEEANFQDADYVEKGQVLFVIEKDLYIAARNQASASLATAKAEAQMANADLGRIQQAAKTNAVSAQDVDLAKANVAKAEAGVTAAEAEVERAELDLKYTDVLAPISGQISEDIAGVGNLVGFDGPTLLATIKEYGTLFVDFDVPEKAILAVARAAGWNPEKPPKGNYPVYVGTEIDEGFPYEGYLDFVQNTVDPTTGTMAVRAQVPNSDYKLLAGVYVRVRMPVGEFDDAILIDEAGVGRDIGGTFVYTVGDDSVVSQKYVELGPQQDDGTVVIVSGIEPTDRYIVEGLLRARPGAPVTPTEAAAKDTPAESEASANTNGEV